MNSSNRSTIILWCTALKPCVKMSKTFLPQINISIFFQFVCHQNHRSISHSHSTNVFFFLKCTTWYHWNVGFVLKYTRLPIIMQSKLYICSQGAQWTSLLPLKRTVCSVGLLPLIKSRCPPPLPAPPTKILNRDDHMLLFELHGDRLCAQFDGKQINIMKKIIIILIAYVCRVGPTVSLPTCQRWNYTTNHTPPPRPSKKCRLLTKHLLPMTCQPGCAKILHFPTTASRPLPPKPVNFNKAFKSGCLPASCIYSSSLLTFFS